MRGAPRIFKEERNLKSQSESAALAAQEGNFASGFWRNFNRLKNLEEKLGWWESESVGG